VKENNNSGKENLTRRDFIRRTSLAAGTGLALSYLALAPEDFPLSLRDSTGERGVPKPELYRLKDFSVTPEKGKAPVGIGRNGTTGQMLQKALDAIGGIRSYIKRGDLVLIKPNVAFDRSPILGSNTHPHILEALIRMLFEECGASGVRITDNPIESPWDCFVKSGIAGAAEKAGGRIYLPDSNAFRILHTPGATLIEKWEFLSRPFRDVDKVIGIAPVKDHNLCQASMSLKNWYGLLGGERNRFHQDIHEIISDLGIMIKPTLAVLDGTHVLMKNGPTGGDPSYVQNGNAVVAGTDQVAMDAWAYRHLLKREGDIPEYLKKAYLKGAGKYYYNDIIREIV
jgi:uncharacterized protein (DUF362 family)